MNKSIYLFFVFLILSCSLSPNQGKELGAEASSQIELDRLIGVSADSIVNIDRIGKHCEQVGIDSVFIEYIGYDFYDIKFSNNQIVVTGGIVPPRIKYINNVELIDRFINYIDMFYISETERIEYSRNKRGYFIVAEYPCWWGKIYMKDKQVLKYYTQVGDENYDIEYNPLFVEFFHYLEGIKQLE